MSQHKASRYLYATVCIGSIVGLVASFLQMLDKLEHLKNPSANLICNVSSVFNCSNVLDAWQSSVFGFPNSLMCIVFFTFMLGLGVAGLSGSAMSKWVRYIAQFLSLFFLGFGAWYLWQSIYVVGAICIYCLACYAGVILLNFAWLRINKTDLPLPNSFTRYNYDVVLWVLWTLALAVAIIAKFYL